MNQLRIQYLYEECEICLYLILFAVPAARNSKHWSWEAVNRVVLTVKVRTLKSRCLFLPIEVVVIPPPPAVLAVGQDVPVAPVPAVVPVIRLVQSAIICQFKERNYK